MPIEKSELRRVMGHFPTGVTVITTMSKTGELRGLTANALCSLSLEPPLLLICVDKKSETYPCFQEGRVFTVNMLASDQEHVSRRFAISGGDKFDGTAYRIGANGVPILDGSLAYLECSVVGSYDGGDHTIYIGQVEQAEAIDGKKPLLFYRGGYREIGD
jgi:flavin reductase (DIM6/NTAB) family NADH-FMN oxidoreductase RutF